MTTDKEDVNPSNLSSPAPDVEVEDGLEIHPGDDIADDEDGDDEDEATRDLPTDDYEQAENDHDDQPG